MKSKLTIAICVMASYVSAQYKPIQSASSIEFNVKYIGINTRGTLEGVMGQIKWGGSLVDSKFDISVDANSIQTGVELRDKHLRDADFLDVSKYPLIRFVSSEITASNTSGTFLMRGQLTLKNHSKEISFPFTATSITNGFQFKGSFVINRQDFEVGKSAVISDKVEVAVNVSAVN
ncbi:hypothetical protein WSM22_40180 [Cytophagales bacterium WSM2-2]|nr:hypothetical protein WSM22_40180 [Cytophagales bacterium WSM2-2]